MKEEGVYLTKRVDKLPVRGNANYLYELKSELPLQNRYRWIGGRYETLSIGSVTGADISELLIEDSDVDISYIIDYSLANTWLLTLTGDTTLSESNLPTTGKTRTITLYIIGVFTLTLPAAWTNVAGVYDGTVLNQLVIEYINPTTYWVSINQI